MKFTEHLPNNCVKSKSGSVLGGTGRYFIMCNTDVAYFRHNFVVALRKNRGNKFLLKRTCTFPKINPPGISYCVYIPN